jgi:hypothetical protein
MPLIALRSENETIIDIAKLAGESILRVSTEMEKC